jgi:hypothetical protein
LDAIRLVLSFIDCFKVKGTNYFVFAAALAAALTVEIASALPVSLRVARALTGDVALTRRASSSLK